MEFSGEQIEKVLVGDLKFSQLGFSMMITRLKGVYGKSPTPAVLQECSQEISKFVNKYGAIMAQDIALISKL